MKQAAVLEKSPGKAGKKHGPTRASRSTSTANGRSAVANGNGSEEGKAMNRRTVKDRMARPATLSDLIRERLEGCSRAQRDVALYIVDHLEESAFQTAEQLAAQVQTSSSTVVRFSQALGFDGFPELQAAAREEYRAARRAEEGGEEALFMGVDPTPAESVVVADRVNLQETARRMDGAVFERAIAAIGEARQILVCGTDQMAFFASYLRHLLMLLDHRCELVASPSQESISRVARIDQDTLVICFCAGRPHTIITRAMRLAATRGAPSLAITDASLSEVAKLADNHLYYSSTSPSFVRSHVALLAIVQGLVHGLYATNSDVYGGRIRAYRAK